MKKKIKNFSIKKMIILLLITLILLIIFNLWLIRAISPRQLDDVTPGIDCDKKLIEKSDILWVVPNYNNQSIANDSAWCKNISSTKKKIGMHGVVHNYREFQNEVNQTYLNEGIFQMEQCFGKKPDSFKPPQLAISKNNSLLIKNSNMTLNVYFNQLIHKVYHCEDTGRLPNWFIDLF